MSQVQSEPAQLERALLDLTTAICAQWGLRPPVGVDVTFVEERMARRVRWRFEGSMETSGYFIEESVEDYMLMYYSIQDFIDTLVVLDARFPLDVEEL